MSSPRPPHVPSRASQALVPLRRRAQRGMTTAEYAVGTVAACALGGILIKLLTSPEVRALLLRVLRGALTPFGG